MNSKNLGIAAILAALMATAAFAVPAIQHTYAEDDDDDDNNGGDSSETNTEQTLKQSNVGSGASTNTNCGQNVISSNASLTCPGATFDPTVD